MRWHRLGWLGALLALYGCQVIAGLEERSARTQEAGAGEGGEGGSAGDGGQGGASGAGAGAAGAAGAGAAGAAGSLGLARPPARVGKPELSGKKPTPKIFIVKNILFGNRKAPYDKKTDLSFWKTLGFDFDGKCTTPQDFSGVCSRTSNDFLDALSTDGYYDGDGCRDNAFGGRIFKAIGFLQANFDQELNQSVEYQGAQTLMLEIEDLDDGPDDPLAPANVYLAAHVFDGAPDWLGNNERILDKTSIDFFDKQGQPVDVAQVPDGALSPDLHYKAKFRYEQGYVANNVWVSGPFEPEKGAMPRKNILPLGGLTLDVELKLSALTLTFGEPAHESVIESQFGGIVPTSELKAALPGLIDELFPKQCGGVTILPADPSQIVDAAADLMPDAPFSGSPSAPCGAIGLGLGLIWAPGTISRPPNPTNLGPFVSFSKPIDPCAGKGGAGGAGGQAGAGQSGSAGSDQAGQGGSAGDSQGGSAGDAQGGSAGDAQGGSAGDAQAGSGGAGGTG